MPRRVIDNSLTPSDVKRCDRPTANSTHTLAFVHARASSVRSAPSLPLTSFRVFSSIPSCSRDAHCDYRACSGFTTVDTIYRLLQTRDGCSGQVQWKSELAVGKLLRDEYDEDRSIDDLAAEHGYSIQRVRRYLKIAGTQMRSPGIFRQRASYPHRKNQHGHRVSQAAQAYSSWQETKTSFRDYQEGNYGSREQREC